MLIIITNMSIKRCSCWNAVNAGVFEWMSTGKPVLEIKDEREWSGKLQANNMLADRVERTYREKSAGFVKHMSQSLMVPDSLSP